MTPEPQTAFFYRYEDAHDVVLLNTYPVVKRTPKGVWIQVTGWPERKRKFVLNDAVKRWAHDTRDGAKTNFLARKRRQLSILHNRIIDIEACVAAINEDRIADYSSTRYYDV